MVYLSVAVGTSDRRGLLPGDSLSTPSSRPPPSPRPSPPPPPPPHPPPLLPLLVVLLLILLLLLLLFLLLCLLLLLLLSFFLRLSLHAEGNQSTEGWQSWWWYSRSEIDNWQLFRIILHLVIDYDFKSSSKYIQFDWAPTNWARQMGPWKIGPWKIGSYCQQNIIIIIITTTQNPPEETGDDASQTQARQNWKKIFAVKRFLRLVTFSNLNSKIWRRRKPILQLGSIDAEKRACWAGGGR